MPQDLLCRLAGMLFCSAAIAAAQSSSQAPLTDRERVLLDRIEMLEKRVEALEAKSSNNSPPTSSSAPVAPPAASTKAIEATAAVANKGTEEATKNGILGLSGTTLNLYFDGYYGWNFDRPENRTNLLRANDTLSNNFTVNQVGLVLERPPDVAAGRRYGVRVDLMYGQNTETLQGSPQNEARPQVYRNLFQAYGTYVFPVGSGLTVDFGKFYSALGFENNYAFQQINYSRSYYFDFLPFYHMGVRTTYNVNDKLSVQHWLVNGENETEDFNGFKSNAFLVTIKPAKTVSWNVNYYVGQESRTPSSADGRTHIFDSYASWSATNKLTTAVEFDYVVGRQFATSRPSYVVGGAGYLQYQFTPRFYLAGRFEYLRDRGGLFSGIDQALKEHTVTASYQFVDGFQTRIEYRRDFSNTPFFFTATPGLLKREQNTATLGVMWWFGGKREAW